MWRVVYMDPTSFTGTITTCMEIISGVKAENRPSIGTDSIMRLIALVIVAIAVSSVDLSTAEDPPNSFGNLDVPGAAVKLDKNLRRALLKALTDLEADSAEQRKDDGQPIAQAYTAEQFQDKFKKDLSEKIAISKEASFSFKGFPTDEETPGEDKLQNSSFVETSKYVPSGSSSMTIEKASSDDARSFHVQNVIMSDKSLRTNVGPKVEQLETKKSNIDTRGSYVNKVESVTLQPVTQLSEGLTGVASNGIAIAQMLPVPKPTASSPTEPTIANETFTNKSKVIEKSEEVKIFQAPLVAAFTVQQDENGAPKSVVPIFRPSGDGQALTLQEQLDFKQKLLEKQLEELQQQQIQQTQFLIRQRHLYEQQLRQKQQQQYYLQEQARVKQIEEQARLKQLEEQRYKQQLEEQRYKQQLEEQRLKQFEDPRIYRFQQQLPLSQQKHRFFEQATNLLSFPTPGESSVRLQPSVSLEVPSAVIPPPFQVNYQEQLRLQQLRQQQQQQHQQYQQHQQQNQQQQQRLQQSFGPINDFQPPVAASTRFNRQEAFNSVGNFGFNDKPTATRNAFAFGVPQRTSINNVYNPYVQYRQIRPQQTPANQIQHLLFQSGIAGDLGNAHGSGGQEDLNILSKVLALNVGHVPNQNHQNLHYTTSNRGGSLGHTAA